MAIGRACPTASDICLWRSEICAR